LSKASNKRGSPKEPIKHMSAAEIDLDLAEYSDIGSDSTTPRIASRPIANRKVTTEKTERPRTTRYPAALLCGLVVPGQEARLDSATTRASALETGLHFHFGDSLVSVRPGWQKAVVKYRTQANKKRGAYPFSNEVGIHCAIPPIEHGAANAKRVRINRTLKEALGCSPQVEVQAKPKKTWRN